MESNTASLLRKLTTADATTDTLGLCDSAADELDRLRARNVELEREYADFRAQYASEIDHLRSECQIAVAQRDAETARADENKRSADAANAKLAGVVAGLARIKDRAERIRDGVVETHAIGAAYYDIDVCNESLSAYGAEVVPGWSRVWCDGYVEFSQHELCDLQSEDRKSEVRRCWLVTEGGRA